MTDEPTPPKPVVVNYSSNSQKSKQPSESPTDIEAPKIGRVVDGAVVERKTPLSKKFFSAYAGDDAQSVGNYLLFDVIVPATKNIISDIVSQGIERLLFGTVRPRGTVSTGIVGNARTNYGQYSSLGNRQPQQQASHLNNRDREMHDFSQWVIPTRGEAEMVIDALGALIEEYGFATVADLYASLGLTAAHTDIKYGWKSLGGARVSDIRGGFVLNLPRTMLLP